MNPRSSESRFGLILVGNPDPIHIGGHLRAAAEALRIPIRFCDSGHAFRAGALIAKFNWWLRGHRPTRLRAFSEEVVRTCLDSQADCLISTGIAPLDAEALIRLGKAGVLRMNFLTDDPWNRRHSAPWFLQALLHYDTVFSPRRANMEDLGRTG